MPADTPGDASTPSGPARTSLRLREFADRGLSGARVDHIAVRTQTTKRMIYYCFGGKEQLFEAVLEQAYWVRGIAASGSRCSSRTSCSAARIFESGGQL